MRIETIVIAFILLQTNIRTNIINMILRVDLQNFEYFPNTPKSPNPNRKLSYRVGINLAPEHRTWSPTNFRNEVSCNVPHLYRSSPFFFYLLPPPPLPVKLPSRADSLWLLGRTLPWKAVSNFHTRTADRR